APGCGIAAPGPAGRRGGGAGPRALAAAAALGGPDGLGGDPARLAPGPVVGRAAGLDRGGGQPADVHRAGRLPPLATHLPAGVLQSTPQRPAAAGHAPRLGLAGDALLLP